MQDLTYLGLINTGTWLVQAALTVVFVLAGSGFWALAISWVGARCFATVVIWWRLRLVCPGLSVLAPGRPEVQASWDLLKRGLWVSVGRVAQLLLNGMDLFILGYVLGPGAVVVYACTGKTITLLGNQIYVLATTADPALSEVRVGGSREQMARISAALSQLTLLASGLVAVVVLATNEGFVGLWVGAQLYGGTMLTVWLLVSMLLRHLTFTLGHLLYCFGYERALAFLLLADGLVTVAGVLELVALAGPAGAPLGSLLGVCLTSLPVSLYLLARDSGLTPLGLLRCHWPWLWRFTGLVLVLVLVGQVWKPRELPGLAATGAGVGLAYGLLMLPMSLRSQMGPYLRPRLLGLWIRLTQVLPLRFRKA